MTSGKLWATRNEIVFDIQVHLFEEVLHKKLNLTQKAKKWHKKEKIMQIRS